MRRRTVRAAALVAIAFVVAGACSSGSDATPAQKAGGVVPPGEATAVSQTAQGPVRPGDVGRGHRARHRLVDGLRPGRQAVVHRTRPAGCAGWATSPQTVDGVVEQGESGLHGDGLRPRRPALPLLHRPPPTTASSATTPPAPRRRSSCRAIRKAQIHDGGRLALGPDGALYVGTGDAAEQDLAQDDASLNGKILRLDTATGAGHRLQQGAPQRAGPVLRRPAGGSCRPSTAPTGATRSTTSTRATTAAGPAPAATASRTGRRPSLPPAAPSTTPTSSPAGRARCSS